MRRFAALFGEVLLYQHQRIITMTKGYIASNNLPVEIIRFHTIHDDFDSVPHKRLLVKMENYGITGKILGWCKHFLSDRRQRVVINGEKSAWKRVIYGVPQGSTIGPQMFVLFINDMPEVVTSCIEMFADDAKFPRLC